MMKDPNLSIRETSDHKVGNFLDKYKSTASGVLAENQKVFENLYQEQFDMEPNTNEYGTSNFLAKR